MRLADVLLVLVPGLPLALAAAWIVPTARRRLVPLVPWATVPAVVLPFVAAEPAPSWSYPGFATGMTLALDGQGRAFLLVVAILWAAVGAFARAYHATDPRRERFFGLFVLTMVGNLGLVVAGDPLTFYFFFTWMTFAAYGLVVHDEGPAALRAGRVYIVLALVGELGLLAALFLIGGAGSMPAFGSELGAMWTALERSGRADLVAGLVVVGFGVKAGLIPLHVWLPLAHPVAPTPASALLSGTMIKGGLLAWLRFLPSTSLEATGTALLALGLAGIAYGIVLGMMQDDAKTVLAYSSVSQMGFMAAGTGLWLRAEGPAPVAVLAVVTYALHHAVAKTTLFLAVGVADRTAAAPRGRGSGMEPPRGRPWAEPRRLLLLGAALPALALAGAPLSSGHLAKTVLKDAAETFGPSWSLSPYLAVAAFGTTLLVIRFLVLLDRRGRRASDHTDSARADAGKGSENAGGWLTNAATLSWAVLVLGGVLAPWWIPALFRPEGAPSPPPLGYGWLEAAAPIALAVALAWIARASPRIRFSARRLRAPAGDLVVLAEGLLRRLRPLLRPRGVPGAELARRSWHAAKRGWPASAGAVDLPLARGRMLGVSLLVIVAALVTLLA